MKFRRIFGNHSDYKLFAVCYSEDSHRGKKVDIFAKLMRQWNDIQYLYNFFTEHQADLNRPFWQGMTIDGAIDQVMDEAADFEDELKAIETKQPGYENIKLEDIFQNLHKDEFLLRSGNWAHKKAKPNFDKPMLRIYAIAFDGCFIITGGAIKLIDQMTGIVFEDQITKLKNLQAYLKIEQIVTKKGLEEDL